MDASARKLSIFVHRRIPRTVVLAVESALDWTASKLIERRTRSWELDANVIAKLVQCSARTGPLCSRFWTMGSRRDRSAVRMSTILVERNGFTLQRTRWFRSVTIPFRLKFLLFFPRSLLPLQEFLIASGSRQQCDPCDLIRHCRFKSF